MLRAILSIYTKAILHILQGHERQPGTGDVQATTRAAWDITNHGLFSLLFVPTGGSAVFVGSEFERTNPDGGVGHGQLAWAALQKKIKRSSREAIREEPAKMANTPKRSEQDPH